MKALPRTIIEAAAMLRRRETNALELAEVALRAAHGDGFNTWLLLSDERAKAQARAADERLRAGDASLLCGIPWACKDIIGTKGVATTAGSKILEGYVPPYSATVVERLDAAGAVMLGKTNLDEFAMGSSNENSAFGPVKNPWRVDRVPGGSSGGSAVAVAAGEAMFALGTDTGGSIRQPAALCGVVGMKPTYGRVSRYGLIAFASSLDQIGPFTRSVEDTAIVLEAMAGHDPLDATSSTRPNDVLRDFDAGVKGMRLGVPREYYEVDGIEPAVKAAIDAAIKSFRDAGAEIVDVALPHTDYGLAAYYIIAPAECSSNLARFDGIRYGMSTEDAQNVTEAFQRTRRKGFGTEVRRRVMLGTYALSSGYYDAYYLKAQKVRTLIRADFDQAFRDVDAIVTPTTPTAAFRRGEKVDDPLSMYLSDIFTVTINLAGLPGISIPCGLTRERLPVGLQIVGRRFDEETILRLAAALEGELKFRAGRPPLPAAPGADGP